jgi:hypothetical protein
LGITGRPRSGSPFNDGGTATAGLRLVVDQGRRSCGQPIDAQQGSDHTAIDPVVLA